MSIDPVNLVAVIACLFGLVATLSAVLGRVGGTRGISFTLQVPGEKPRTLSVSRDATAQSPAQLQKLIRKMRKVAEKANSGGIR